MANISNAQHAKWKEEDVRGTLRLSDFKPSNMHPKAQFRLCMAIIGTFLIILGCVYMLSTATITWHPDPSTTAGFALLMKDLLAIGYVAGSALIIIILWYLMFHDCPLTPAAKLNYDATHDKTIKGVKVVSAIASAVANKGSGSSINSVGTALEDYFDEPAPTKNAAPAQTTAPQTTNSTTNIVTNQSSDFKIETKNGVRVVTKN